MGRFGGLDLREPEEVGAQGAIDLLNVDLTRSGAVRTRMGSDGLIADANLASVMIWQGAPLGSDWPAIISYTDDDDTIRAYDATGTQIDTLVAVGEWMNGAALGTSAAGPYFYIAGGDGAALTRFDGTNLTAPAGMPNGRFVAVQPVDNRLVVGCPTAGFGSRVQFSDAGAPETWTSTSWVDLFPNDGEEITSLVSWGNFLFAFKPSRYFVFYGNSTDAAGSPVFNYRTVDMGIGAAQGNRVGQQTAVAADDGVYFIHRTGVYRTTGGPPQKISAELDPLFGGTGSTFFDSGAVVEITDVGVGNPGSGFGTPVVLGDRVIVPLERTGGGATGTNYFVYYRATGDWSVWRMPTASSGRLAGPFTTTTSTGFLFVVVGVGISVAEEQYTDDNGTAIASHYRSGFFTVGNQPSQEAVIRESILDGIGTPTFSVSKDYAAVPTTGGGAKASVTLGTSPAYGNGRHRVAQKGRRFSYQIEATSGAWRVNSITHHVRGIRSPGVKST